MRTNFIEFKKQRDLGEIISDTFSFLKHNGKSLLTILLRTAGIPFLVLIVSTVYYTSNTAGLFSSLGDSLASGSIMMSFFIMLITLVVFYGILSGTVLHFIKNYINTKGNVDHIIVIEGVKNDLSKLIGLGLVAGIIIGFGFMFFVIPGIYLYVPMSIVFSILIFKNSTVSDAISDSFALIKNEWWSTFGTLIVISILMSMIGGIFSIPTILYTFTKTFTSATEGSMADPESMFDWVTIFLSTIASTAKYVLYIITVVATAFVYFHLNEKKNATGALEQIDSLGKSE